MTALLIIVLLIAALVLALFLGQRRLETTTKDLHQRLEAARTEVEPKVYQAGELQGLPKVVQRYFRGVIPDNHPMITAVWIEHTGTFNLSDFGENWRPFHSYQRVISKRPGFDWEGHMRMLPGLTARVHDAYIAGEGFLNASLFGWINLVNLQGGEEIAQGELMRFLAEAVWYPTALLPSQGVSWEERDEHSAKASLTDGDISVTLLFRFDDQGLIESVYAEARPRIVNNEMIPAPWEGHFKKYEKRDGLLIPIEGEVAWILPEGRLPYWRGRISRLSYS